MAPASSKPVLPSGDLSHMDNHIFGRRDYSGDKFLSKACGIEGIWCEWCKEKPCNNIEYDDHVMQDDTYATFLEEIDTKYLDNLSAAVPTDSEAFSPKAYIKKIRFWHYKKYSEQFGFAWGGGQYSEIPKCFTAKIRMTFRQPAEDFKNGLRIRCFT